MEGWRTHWKDLYGVLGVRMDAEPEVIKGAYNAMAKKFHPDVNPAGAARMKEVNEAYEVLSDPLRKADYDAAYRARWQSRYGPGRQEDSAGGSGGTAREEAQEPDGAGTGAGGGIRQAASSAWRSLYDRYSTRPRHRDYGEKIIPWPSRGWQQAALLSSIPLGLGLAVLAPLLWFKVGGGALFLAGSYACIETRCVDCVEKANAAGRFLGTIVVLVMLLVIGASMLALALGLAAAVIAALLIWFVAAKALKKS